MGKVLAITCDLISKHFDTDGKPHDDNNDMLGSFIRHGLTQRETKSESVMQLYVSLEIHGGVLT